MLRWGRRTYHAASRTVRETWAQARSRRNGEPTIMSDAMANKLEFNRSEQTKHQSLMKRNLASSEHRNWSYIASKSVIMNLPWYARIRNTSAANAKHRPYWVWTMLPQSDAEGNSNYDIGCSSTAKGCQHYFLLGTMSQCAVHEQCQSILTFKKTPLFTADMMTSTPVHTPSKSAPLGKYWYEFRRDYVEPSPWYCHGWPRQTLVSCHKYYVYIN